MVNDLPVSNGNEWIYEQMLVAVLTKDIVILLCSKDSSVEITSEGKVIKLDVLAFTL